MQSIYTVSSVEQLIQKYIEQGGEMLQMREGVLGCGDVLLYDPSGKLKTYVIREIYLNEWSSGQTVRAYNKMPKKYRAMIDKQ